MTAREEIETVAAEEGWILACPLQMFAVYLRDELILIVDVSEPSPPWVQLACGIRRWKVEKPGAVLEMALAWLRSPYDTVCAMPAEEQLEAAITRMRAELLDQSGAVLPVSESLRNAPDTSEVQT